MEQSAVEFLTEGTSEQKRHWSYEERRRQPYSGDLRRASERIQIAEARENETIRSVVLIFLALTIGWVRLVEAGWENWWKLGYTKPRLRPVEDFGLHERMRDDDTPLAG